MKLTLQIITPEKIAYQGEVDSISLPTEQGEITILPKHIPLVSTVQNGAMTVRNDQQEVVMAVYNGFVEVHNNHIIIMTDLAERVEEIDAEKANTARKEAEKKLLEKDRMDEVAFADTVAILEKSLARLRATKKYRRK